MSFAPSGAFELERANPFDEFKKFFRWATEPSAHIMDSVERQRIRTLSRILISMCGLFVCVNIAYAFVFPHYGLPLPDIAGYVMLLSAYVLSRTRYAWMAVILTLAMFPMNVFGTLLLHKSPNPTGTLSFLFPGFVIASFVLPAASSLVYTLCNIFAIQVLTLATGHHFLDRGAIVGPVSVSVVSVALLMFVRLHRRAERREHRDEVKRAHDALLESWVRMLEMRDKQTHGHSRRVTELTMRLARELGIPESELEDIYRGAMLHDIGKLAVPDHILMKPEELNDAERAIMRSHTTMAYEMLHRIPFLSKAVHIPVYHHEWWDGSGYPFGLKGEQIPLPARIFTVTDVWDALLSDRPYRMAWTKEQAKDYMRSQSGKQFDPRIIALFLGML